MSNKRNPGKNGSLQRNWEKAERRARRAYHQSYWSSKKRIRKKAWKTYWKTREALRSYISNCEFGDT